MCPWALAKMVLIGGYLDWQESETRSHFFWYYVWNRAAEKNKWKSKNVTWGPACWGICSRLVPHNRQVPEKINHTEISISYKADWPISSGFLLTFIAYINPLFSSMLAIWLGTFSSGAAYIFPFWWSGQNCGGSFLLARILPVSLLHLYFLSGFPAYTACLANQRFIKIWLTEYR